MRLELALIVGILLFCSWCAYIVARMSSSANVNVPNQAARPAGGAAELVHQDALATRSTGENGVKHQLFAATNQTVSGLDKQHLRHPLIGHLEQRQYRNNNHNQYWPQQQMNRLSEASEPNHYFAQPFGAQSLNHHANYAQAYAPQSGQQQQKTTQYDAYASAYPHQQQQQHFADNNAATAATSVLALAAPESGANESGSGAGAAEDDETNRDGDDARQPANELDESGNSAGAQTRFAGGKTSDEDYEQQLPAEDASGGGAANNNGAGDDEDYAAAADAAELDGGELGDILSSGVDLGTAMPVQSELEEVSNRRSFDELESDSNERDKDGSLVVSRRTHLINGKPAAVAAPSLPSAAAAAAADQQLQAQKRKRKRKRAQPSSEKRSRRASKAEAAALAAPKQVTTSDGEDSTTPKSLGHDDEAGESDAEEADFDRLVDEIDEEDKLRKQAAATKARSNGSSSPSSSSSSPTRPEVGDTKVNKSAPEASPGRRGDSEPVASASNPAKASRLPVGAGRAMQITKQAKANEDAKAKDSHEHNVQETLLAQQWDDDSPQSERAAESDKRMEKQLERRANGDEEDADATLSEDENEVSNIVERDPDARQLEQLARNLLQNEPARTLDDLDEVAEEAEKGRQLQQQRQQQRKGHRGKRDAASLRELDEPSQLKVAATLLASGGQNQFETSRVETMTNRREPRLLPTAPMPVVTATSIFAPEALIKQQQQQDNQSSLGFHPSALSLQAQPQFHQNALLQDTVRASEDIQVHVVSAPPPPFRQPPTQHRHEPHKLPPPAQQSPLGADQTQNGSWPSQARFSTGLPANSSPPPPLGVFGHYQWPPQPPPPPLPAPLPPNSLPLASSAPYANSVRNANGNETTRARGSGRSRHINVLPLASGSNYRAKKSRRNVGAAKRRKHTKRKSAKASLAAKFKAAQETLKKLRKRIKKG